MLVFSFLLVCGESTLLAGGLAANQGCRGIPQPLSLQAVTGPFPVCSAISGTKAPGLAQVQGKGQVGQVWFGAEHLLRGVAEQGSSQ